MRRNPTRDSEASDEALNMTKADVLEMVMALPMWQVRERQAWIEVGMSIKHQLGDEGLDVFREFSKPILPHFDST